MLDLFNLPTAQSNADVQVFTEVRSAASVYTWKQWNKPRGASMCFIMAIGPGGDGGAGAVGAASTAAGGGGGGSGGQSTLLIPSIFLPDQLFVFAPSAAANSTAVAVDPTNLGVTNQQHVILRAQGGGNGGAASGVTAGTAGAAGATATISLNPLAGLGKYNLLAGQAGTAGGGGNASDLNMPTTGLVVTGGCGGGGLGTLNSAGGAPGRLLAAGKFPETRYVTLGTPGFDQRGQDGAPGFKPLSDVLYFYGGNGGASQSLSATGSPVGGGNGGEGSYGCGGGGGGGGFTGSAAALGGNGGPGLVVIISW
jgi:hypothetical protein